MAERHVELTRPEEKGVGRPDVLRGSFQMLERLADEMDRVFDDFGLGRRWFAPHLTTGWPRGLPTERWIPAVEVRQRNNELIVRADLPGLTKDDVKVDITENTLTLQGERHREHEEEDKAGIYRSERTYGRFSRTFALPEGAMSDQAKATFKDGVLEITMPAPPEPVKRERRLEIMEAAEQK
jgi:HSP20 family protein